MYFLEVNKVRPDADREKLGTVIPPHVKWINEQIAKGQIIQAGKWGDAGGMAIIKAGDITEAKNILSQDPLVQSGLITFEVAELSPVVKI